MKIQAFELQDGRTIYIETVDAADISAPKSSGPIQDLPSGEGTSFSSHALDAFKNIANQIGALVEDVHDGLRATKPEEITVELKVGFAGEVDLIPFIASGKTDSALKIVVKWKNARDKE